MKTHFYDNAWHAGTGAELSATSSTNNQEIWRGNAAAQEQVNAAIE